MFFTFNPEPISGQTGHLSISFALLTGTEVTSGVMLNAREGLQSFLA
jgi:hypothetical protein